MYKCLLIVFCGVSAACGLKETTPTDSVTAGIFLQVNECSDSSVSLPQKKALNGQGPFSLYSEMAAYYQSVCNETLPALFTEKIKVGASNCRWDLSTKVNGEAISVIQGISDGDKETVIELNFEGIAGDTRDIQIKIPT